MGIHKLLALLITPSSNSHVFMTTIAYLWSYSIFLTGFNREIHFNRVISGLFYSGCGDIRDCCSIVSAISTHEIKHVGPSVIHSETA